MLKSASNHLPITSKCDGVQNDCLRTIKVLRLTEDQFCKTLYKHLFRAISITPCLRCEIRKRTINHKLIQKIIYPFMSVFALVLTNISQFFLRSCLCICFIYEDC